MGDECPLRDVVRQLCDNWKPRVKRGDADYLSIEFAVEDFHEAQRKLNGQTDCSCGGVGWVSVPCAEVYNRTLRDRDIENDTRAPQGGKPSLSLISDKRRLANRRYRDSPVLPAIPLTGIRRRLANRGYRDSPVLLRLQEEIREANRRHQARQP